MTFKYKEFKRIRKEKRWALGQLGNAMGISRRALTNWENGHSEPRESYIKKLAQFLDIPVSSISDLTDSVPLSTKNIESSAAEFMSFYKEDNLNRNKFSQIIADIKLFENKLSESSMVINAIINSINSPIYLKDINQKYILSNNAFIKNLGFDKKYRVAGKTDQDFFSASEAEDNTKEDQKVLESGEEILNKEQFLPGSRKRKWGMVSKTPVFDSENKIVGLFGLFYDITEKTKSDNLRKLMETAFLKESSNVLYIYNTKLKLIYLSDSFEVVYGYPPVKCFEDSDFWINACLHNDYKKAFMSYKDIKAFPPSINYKGFDSKGRIKWLEAHTHKFTYLNTECIAVIERDISHHKDLIWKNIAMYEIINSINNVIVWSGILKVDMSIGFSMLTDNIEKITGYKKEAFIASKKSLFDLMEKEDITHIQSWMTNAPTSSLTMEHKLLCNNGREVEVNSHLYYIINQNNEKYYFGIHTVK